MAGNGADPAASSVNRRQFMRVAGLAGLAVPLVAMAGCGDDESSQPSAATGTGTAVKAHIRILQTGVSVGQAPYAVLEESKIIETDYPDFTVDWKATTSGITADKMLLNGQVDAAIFAYAPFLVALSNGLKARVAAGGVGGGMKLNVNDPSYTSIADFKEGDKIATPGPASIQAMLLSMAAKEKLGSWDALDKYIVTMPHPQAVQALLSKQIRAHFGIAPYSFQAAAQPGIKTILTGEEAFGSTTPVLVNALFVTDAWAEKNRAAFDALIASVRKAFDKIHSDPAGTAALLAKQGGGDEKELLEELKDPQMSFDFAPTGIQHWADFMHERGLIKQQFTLDDLIFDHLRTESGVS